MTISRRNFVFGLPAIGSLTFASKPAFARGEQDTLRVLVGFPPGGGTDTVARQVSDPVSRILDRVIVVDNKAGAGGMIATQQLKAARPDGNTIMFTMDHTQMIVPLTFKNPGYHALSDFTPLAGVTSNALSLAVAGNLGVKSMDELEAWLKAQTGRVVYGIPAPGSIPQFAGYLIGKAVGKPLVPVGYKGGAPLIADLLGGQIPMAIQSIAEQIDHHRAGTIRILASTGQARTRIAPEVPTFSEAGVPGLEQSSWTAYFGPKGLSPTFVDTFSNAVRESLQNDDLKARLAKLGNEVDYKSPMELAELVEVGSDHWRTVIQQSGFELL